MIRTNKTCVYPVILLLLFILVFNHTTMSQPPPPPPGGTPGSGGHNLNENQGGAPVGEGIWILFTLAISYGLHGYMKRRENAGDESLQVKRVRAKTNNSDWEKHESGIKALINTILRPYISRNMQYYRNTKTLTRSAFKI